MNTLIVLCLLRTNAGLIERSIQLTPAQNAQYSMARNNEVKIDAELNADSQALIDDLCVSALNSRQAIGEIQGGAI